MDTILNGGFVDLSYTGLTELKGELWNQGMTIRLPSCFLNCKSSICEGVTLDYVNVLSANEFNCKQVNSINYDNFTGYKTILCGSENPISIIGKNTETLSIGKWKSTGYTKPIYKYNLREIVEKGTNIYDFVIHGGAGFSDISVLSPLKLTTLEIQYSSLYKLKSDETDFGNMANSLTTLKINNCSTFNDLDGLDKLNHITTLDLSNNQSLGNIQTVTKPDGTKENKSTCRYIVESLPDLQKVTLKGCELNDFSYLTSHGFTETSNGSREFTKNSN